MRWFLRRTPPPSSSSSSSSLLRHLRLRLLRGLSAASAPGSAWSFGDNSNGAVGAAGGLSPSCDAYEPARVSSLPSSQIASVAAGHYHSLAVAADGRLWAWGRNADAQLARPPAAPRSQHPTRGGRPDGPSHIRSDGRLGRAESYVQSGGRPDWAESQLKPVGVVYLYALSELVVPSNKPNFWNCDTWSSPQRVVGLDSVKVRAAAASGVISAAIGDDGSLWVWGRSKRGQLGLGREVTEAIKPSRVEALAGHDVVKVSFGWGHALALTKDGKLFGWGYSEDGRLGQMGQIFDANSKQPPDLDEHAGRSDSALDVVEKLVAERIEREDHMPIIWEPSLVQELSDVEVSDVSCGLDHSLVLCSDGTLLSCGDNTYGQLGRKTEGSELLPVETDFSFKPLSISAGLGHSLLLCETGSEREDGPNVVLSWGWNRSSQLGRQGREDVPSLVEGLSGENPVSVSAGRVHSIALTSKGEVWAWGSGRNGRLGLGSSMDEAEPAILDCLEGFQVLQAVAGFDHNLLLVAESCEF